MCSLSSLCLNNFPHRFGQRVNFRISFKLNEWAMCRLLCPLYSLVSQSKNQNFCVWTNRYVTLPVLHNSPRQIPFLDCRFLQFYFLYHSSYELCYYNVHRYVSLFTRTSISIVFCQSFMGVSTTEELRHAISACKDLINTTSDDSEEKRKLITKLVQLRLKLQETQVCPCMIYFSRDLIVKSY